MRKLSTETAGRLPEVYYHSEQFLADGVKRKLQSLRFIIDAIEMPDRMIESAIDLKRGQISWYGIEAHSWPDDARIAVKWMKSIWTEKFHITSDSIFGAWPSSFEIREAIFKALAHDAYMKYMFHSGYFEFHDSENKVSLKEVV